MKILKSVWILSLILFCAPPLLAQVMLNEVCYDNPGMDDPNVLFTEIYGPPGANLTGWSLVGINGNGGIVYRTVMLQGSIPADGYFVVGNTALVANVDYVCGGASAAGVDWQNAGSGSTPDCDGLDLRDGDGDVVDHLCYGTCATPGCCTGEGGTNAVDYDPPFAGPAKSLSRIPDHTDTDNNGTDWVSSETMTPGLPNSVVPCQPWYTTLLPLRQNDANGVPVHLDTFVVVRGIVNMDNYVLDSLTLSRFYIQDDDAGINMYRGTVPPNIVAGDCLEVSAWVGFYGGLTELISSGSGSCVYSVERVAHVAPPTPTVITCSSPFEVYEGMLVRINNVSIVSGTWPAEGQYGDLVITDGNGTVGLYISKWTNVDGSPPPPPTFHIIGVMAQYDPSSPYNTGYEILPRNLCDIVRGSSTPSAGYAELIQAGPPEWGYRLHHINGCVERLVFTNVCSGTSGHLTGTAAENWSALSNGDGNDGDSIIFVSSVSLSAGAVDTFWLSHPTCSDMIRWCVGDTCGQVDGPLPVELLGINAVATAEGVKLQWNTASENDNDHFEILRGTSETGEFSRIATLPSQGNSASGHHYEYLDRDVTAGQMYWYYLADVDLSGNRTEHREMMRSATMLHSAATLEEYMLSAYPNPFNPQTTIAFALLEAQQVRLAVFDLTGRMVRELANATFTVGQHQIVFDASDLPSGLYVARIESGRFVQSEKLLLLK